MIFKVFRTRKKVIVFIKTNETLPTFFQCSLTLGEKGTKTQDQNQG